MNTKTRAAALELSDAIWLLRGVNGPYCANGHTSLTLKRNARTLHREATPNPSLKRSANGRPPGPRGAWVHVAPRGPGVLPSSPA